MKLHMSDTSLVIASLCLALTLMMLYIFASFLLRDQAMKTKFLALAVGLLIASPVVSEEVITGQIVGVHDGDTVRMTVGQAASIEIRLSEIDAPEVVHGNAPAQPYGAESRELLKKLALGKQCQASVSDTDRYGRKIARLDCDGKHVNREMVHAGAAWVYTQYPHSTVMELEENQAQNSKRGLWALPDEQRIEPWRWRKGEREPLKPEPKEEFSCGTKLYCSEMRSCAEARFHLTQCGQKSLDKDYDGTPCESLCGQ